MKARSRNWRRDTSKPTPSERTSRGDRLKSLVRRSLSPYWGKLKAADITRVDVKAMMARIEAPVLANQTLAAASAIFAWAIREDILKANPCAKVERNEVRSRERVLLGLRATEVLGLPLTPPASSKARP